MDDNESALVYRVGDLYRSYTYTVTNVNDNIGKK